MESTTVERRLAVAAGRLRHVVVPLARQLRLQTADRFTPTQLSVFGSIHRHGPISVGDLAARERLSVPMISKVVTALEKQRVIERVADDQDRRICRLVTTPKGTSWIEESRALRDAWLAERIGALSLAEQTTLTAALPVLERLLDDG